MSLSLGIALTIFLLVANGSLIAAEFALVAAKRPRLERAAAEGHCAAASAIAGIRELSLMLAGAQLGITICSLGLGIVSEPVIAELLTPVFHTVGLSGNASHVISFVIALALITFLHMVIGEMAPKSWAIAAPERSATLLALPFRGFTKLFRPVLTALNGITNGLLRLFRVMPGDGLAISRTPEQLKHLRGGVRRLGLIEEADRNVLSRALQAPQARLGSLIVPIGEASSVPPDALPQAVIDTSARTGHTRLLLRTESGEVTGLVHAREAYLARAAGKAVEAATMAHPVPALAEETPVAEAVTALRRHHSELALVEDATGRIIGLISLDDLLTSLLSPA